MNYVDSPTRNDDPHVFVKHNRFLALAARFAFFDQTGNDPAHGSDFLFGQLRTDEHIAQVSHHVGAFVGEAKKPAIV